MGLFGRAKKEQVTNDDIKQEEVVSPPREERISPEIRDLRKEIEEAAITLESYTH